MFNGENAQALADLRAQLTASGGTSTLGGSVRQIVTDLGAQTAALSRAATAQDDPTAGIPWRDDLAAARADAREAGKPLLVLFRCEP